MNLFPMNQPTLALSISEEALCLVEVKKSWRTTSLQQVKHVSLPTGVIQLSSAKPNILNIDTFVEKLRILFETCQKPISIALSLPDLCARTSAFDFSKFPTKPSEQTALLNWRFKQDLKLDTAQSRLAYQVYVPASLANASTHDNPETVRVLGTVIRNEIVEQFESACLDANLIPASVSIAGLDIFDFYQKNIQDILKAEDKNHSASSTGAMFLFMSHWGFTFFAFDEGCPTFVRTKAIAIRPTANHERAKDSSTGWENRDGVAQNKTEPTTSAFSSDDEHTAERVLTPYPLDIMIKVEKEVLATLQYYLETYSQDGAKPAPTHLFFVTDLEHGHMLLPTSEHIQQTAHVSGLATSPIQVTQFSYTTHFKSRGSRSVQESNIWSALPGYASLRVA